MIGEKGKRLVKVKRRSRVEGERQERCEPTVLPVEKGTKKSGTREYNPCKVETS